MTDSPVVSQGPEQEKAGGEQEKRPVGVWKKQRQDLVATLERVCRKAAQGRTSASWRPTFRRGNRPALFELELEGLAEEGADPVGIQPGRGAGLADEGDGAAHAKLGVEGLEVAGEAGQGVEQVGHAHQVVIALHGIPIQGKGVLVDIMF